MRWLAVGAVVAMGCVETATVQCADGETRCPEGSVCVVTPFGAPDARETLCAPGDAFTACEGKSELGGCRFDASDTATSRCYLLEQGLVCLPSGCGNGFIDPSEVCDDRNQLANDGCSIDCGSDETCGNGVIDVVHAEQCDDGDSLSNDGCSSACGRERPRWAPRLAVGPNPRTAPTVTFDPRRGKIVLFGGSFDSTPGQTLILDDTAEWDDRGWTEGPTVIRPSGRASASSIYDDQRRTVLMFGGSVDSKLGDTWEWTGGGWNLLEPTISPTPRGDAGIAADTARDRVVLFGGARDGNKPTSDTWVWRDGQWSELIAVTHPPEDTKPMVTYDSARGVTVVCAAGRTWELGDTWIERGAAPGQPSTLVGGFDPIANRVVAVGELPSGQLRTWEWDGVAGRWDERPNGTPDATLLFAVLADPVRRRLLLVGAASSKARPIVQVWEPTGWRTLDPGQLGNPGADSNQRISAAATSAPTWGTALVFGGYDLVDIDPGPLEVLVEVAHGETWTYDGAAWVEMAPPGPPTPWPAARSRHALAFDERANVAVLFGGVDKDGARVGDTWTWDGSGWTRQLVAGPPARSDHAMAYNPVLGQTILFGGTDGVTLFNDTWSWDGVTWTQLATAIGLAPRAGASLAFDPVRSVLVLFGGATDRSLLGALVSYVDETWNFSGAWQRSSPAAAPIARGHASLAWDAKRARLVLVGGERAKDTGSAITTEWFSDAWEWDGNWRVVAVAGFRQRGRHVAFTAPDGAGIVVAAGYDVGSGDARYPMELLWLDDRGSAGETCVAHVDQDGDGKVGCDDPDCWAACTPLCSPGVTSCASAPACGDATCSPIETVNACSADCGAIPQTCGDLACDPGESCVGDCGP